jgi:uncharacterized protein (DUF58 family)
MQHRYQGRIRLIVGHPRGEVKAPSLPGRVLAFLLGCVALVAAFMVSVLALAVVAVLVVLAVGYLWWKTRDLRRQLRENPPGARVVDVTLFATGIDRSCGKPPLRSARASQCGSISSGS